MSNGETQYTAATATSIVIANMVGTGVFTSLGFQLVDIDAAPVILLLWVIGGIVALCGALCYAELGAALPRSGGEYNFLSCIYHPGVGFVGGWVSATVGFAAPTALAAITAATYFGAVVPQAPVKLVAAGLLLLVTAVHVGSRRSGGGFQLGFTALKVLLILLFVAFAFWQAPELQSVRWAPMASDAVLVGSAGFAVALIYVNYAYTGWNAATYLVGEVADANRKLPRILLVGTVVVASLYLLLHVMFLSVAPMDAMRGKLEIGYVVAESAFGEAGSALVGLMLAILLVSTVSAMVLAGPRVLQVVGQDFAALRLLARENRHGVPHIAICVQTAVSLLLIVTSTFEVILVFSSFVLALNTLLAVVGVFVLRVRQPELARPFRIPLYPWPALIYIAITVWTLVFVALSRPVEALFAAGLVGAGICMYWMSAGTRVSLRD